MLASPAGTGAGRVRGVLSWLLHWQVCPLSMSGRSIHINSLPISWQRKMVKETKPTQLSAQLLYQKDVALQNSRGQLAFFSRPRGLQRQHSFVWCCPAAPTAAALDCQANQNARSRCSRPSQTPAKRRRERRRKRKNTPPVTVGPL